MKIEIKILAFDFTSLWLAALEQNSGFVFSKYLMHTFWKYFLLIGVRSLMMIGVKWRNFDFYRYKKWRSFLANVSKSLSYSPCNLAIRLIDELRVQQSPKQSGVPPRWKTCWFLLAQFRLKYQQICLTLYAIL